MPVRQDTETGMASKSSKTDVLGSGTGYYGHGSIMRVAALVRKQAVLSVGLTPVLPVTRLGNENYKRGHFVEALNLYDKAIAIFRAMRCLPHCTGGALIGLEAVRAGGEGMRKKPLGWDPSYGRAHHRLDLCYLGSGIHLAYFALCDVSNLILVRLLVALGQVEKARSHICFQGHQPDQVELQKVKGGNTLASAIDARRAGDWTSTLREATQPLLLEQMRLLRAEALLKLHQVEDAELSLSVTRKHETSTESSQSKIFGMLSEAYVFFVQAQIDLALGRFENAVSAVERAGQIDPRNIEVSVFLNNARLVGRARTRGNDLFKFEEKSVDSTAIELSVSSQTILKVDVEESPLIANAENVRIVPTFKIYKRGSHARRWICPSQEVLESSVRHYSI
ncbi:hypothetical protein HAX54_010589 [Datura stramonium]|uniref:Uncharacterized protein n=1 Tax=Datura stramonium TaxID=4076 RepID=A0ABS8THI8_DATST|nr:hypothetical protein [Datura stramonium]